MKKFIFPFIIFLSITACKDKVAQTPDSQKIVQFEPLETTEQKINFLQEIFDTDQQVRVESTNIEIEHGRDSNEYIASVEKMNAIDHTNLSKALWYLKNYDYPDVATYGDTRSIVPALVVHHSNDTQIRRQIYPQFKTAYDQGRLSPNLFALYLGRIYEKEKGDYYKMESPYLIEDQIDSLIVQLEL